MGAPVEHILKSHVRDIGGFSVRRVLPAVPKQMVGPFIFFDHMGPAALAPGEGLDVRPHPHIGLATVTYLFDGEILHRDSLGSVQPIRPGDVNWMTAGRGIVHSERTPTHLRAAGGRVHGVQTWVALPLAHEEAVPAFAHHPAAALPVVELPGATVRVIAGAALGVRSPVEVFSGTLYAAAGLAPGASFVLPPEHEERAVYLVDGSASVAGVALESGQMAVLVSGGDVEIRAGAASTVMLVGGAKMDRARFIWWNFVASSRERIERAKADWREDRFPPVPGETERIPLPEK
ncbi:MAG TPA: pirin family protein [Burkholderiales bacterium]|nr:pirin family protein [Burkholderiales bacterium]